MQLWTQSYAAIGTASAALLGLLFVAVSIKLSAALGHDEAVSRRLTEQAFQNYVAVMMVAFLALFPGCGDVAVSARRSHASARWRYSSADIGGIALLRLIRAGARSRL